MTRREGKICIQLDRFYSSMAASLRAAMACWLRRYLRVYWFESHLHKQNEYITHTTQALPLTM